MLLSDYYVPRPDPPAAPAPSAPTVARPAPTRTKTERKTHLHQAADWVERNYDPPAIAPAVMSDLRVLIATLGQMLDDAARGRKATA